MDTDEEVEMRRVAIAAAALRAHQLCILEALGRGDRARQSFDDRTDVLVRELDSELAA
jgi:hypothetical protein